MIEHTSPHAGDQFYAVHSALLASAYECILPSFSYEEFLLHIFEKGRFLVLQGKLVRKLHCQENTILRCIIA